MFDFSMVDNAGVLEFLEGKLGLITSLNEECVRPQGKASSFVYKIKMLHNDSKDLLVDRLQKPCEFGINHFAGAVSYDASEFLQVSPSSNVSSHSTRFFISPFCYLIHAEEH